MTFGYLRAQQQILPLLCALALYPSRELQSAEMQEGKQCRVRSTSHSFADLGWLLEAAESTSFYSFSDQGFSQQLLQGKQVSKTSS